MEAVGNMQGPHCDGLRMILERMEDFPLQPEYSNPDGFISALLQAGLDRPFRNQRWDKQQALFFKGIEDALDFTLPKNIDYASLGRLPVSVLRSWKRKIWEFHNELRFGYDGFVSKEHQRPLLEYLQDAPLPKALIEWHQSKFNILMHEILNNEKLFMALARIYGALAGPYQGHLGDIQYVHKTLAAIWGIPKPDLAFKRAGEMENKGNASHYKTEILDGGEIKISHVFTNKVRVEKEDKSPVPSYESIKTTAHELGHSIEDWMIQILLGAGCEDMEITSAQEKFFNVTDIDGWNLKEAATLFALNSDELGVYVPSEKDYRVYCNQVRERHVRWFAELCDKLFLDCVSNANNIQALKGKTDALWLGFESILPSKRVEPVAYPFDVAINFNRSKYSQIRTSSVRKSRERRLRL